MIKHEKHDTRDELQQARREYTWTIPTEKDTAYTKKNKNKKKSVD